MQRWRTAVQVVCLSRTRRNPSRTTKNRGYGVACMQHLWGFDLPNDGQQRCAATFWRGTQVPFSTRVKPESKVPVAKRLRRRVLATARTFVEANLHPVRRYVATARLQQRATLASVYFVCEGNIYRSPFAAARLRTLLPEPLLDVINIGSGGLIGAGRRCPDEAQQAAATHYDTDLSEHRSQLLETSLRGKWDLIAVMDARQRHIVSRGLKIDPEQIVILGDLDPQPALRRAITDPWQQPTEVLESSYARIDRCVRVLADLIMTKSKCSRALITR